MLRAKTSNGIRNRAASKVSLTSPAEKVDFTASNICCLFAPSCIVPPDDKLMITIVVKPIPEWERLIESEGPLLLALCCESGIAGFWVFHGHTRPPGILS